MYVYTVLSICTKKTNIRPVEAHRTTEEMGLQTVSQTNSSLILTA